MTRNQKLFGIVAIFILIFAFGVATVNAQGPRSDPDNMPFGRGSRGGHHGMMGGGQRGMMGGFGGWMMGDQTTVFAIAADTLGLEVDELWTELRSGKSLLDVAEAQGVDVATLQDALLAEMESNMAEAVAAGYISQDNADAMLSYMRENFTDHLGWMFSGMQNWDGTSRGFFGQGIDGMPCWQYFQDDGDI